MRIRERLSYANVISTVCLFLLLGGGAYAASQLPKNSVGAKQIKKKSITFAKLAPSAAQKLKGTTGPSGAQGSPGSPGPSDLFVTHAAPGLINLESDKFVDIQSLTLPAGQYLVTAHQGVVVSTLGTFGYAECKLVGAGSGSSLARATGGKGGSTLGFSAAVTLTETTELTDSCVVVEGEGEMAINTMVMTAVRVGEIHDQSP